MTTFSASGVSSTRELIQPFLTELKNRNEDVRRQAVKKLRQFVLRQMPDMPRDVFAKFMADVNNELCKLIDSNNSIEKAGGISAMDSLLGIEYDDKSNQIFRVSSN